MRKRVRVLSVVLVMICMTLVFCWSSGNLQSTLSELSDQYEQSRVKLTALESAQSDLRQTLENAGSDEFIENQARTRYGYMMPDEIRFVITNPDALYGTQE